MGRGDKFMQFTENCLRVLIHPATITTGMIWAFTVWMYFKGFPIWAILYLDFWLVIGAITLWVSRPPRMGDC